jgi:hypothetical protein
VFFFFCCALNHEIKVTVDSQPPLDGDPFKILLKEPNGKYFFCHMNRNKTKLKSTFPIGQLHRALLLLREDSFAIYDAMGVAQVTTISL